MWRVEESDNHIEFDNSMTAGARIIIFFFGLFPLLAPYELLIKPRWTGLTIFALLPGIISLGAIVVSIFFFAAALIGLDEMVRFDRKKRIVTYGRRALCVRYREFLYRMSDIRGFRTEEREWTDGPKYYILSIILRGGQKISFGEFSTLAAAQEYQRRISAIIAGS
jgi:hypothetical protein